LSIQNCSITIGKPHPMMRILLGTDLKEEVSVPNVCDRLLLLPQPTIPVKGPEDFHKPIDLHKHPSFPGSRWVQTDIGMRLDKLHHHGAVLPPTQIAVRKNLVGQLTVQNQLVRIRNHVREI